MVIRNVNTTNISQSNSGKDLNLTKNIYRVRRASKFFSPSKSPDTSRRGSMENLR